MVAVEIRGCFWHQHSDAACARSRMPKTRQSYWQPKLRRNVERDDINEAELRRLGWEVIVVWECQCESDAALRQVCDMVISALSRRGRVDSA